MREALAARWREFGSMSKTRQIAIMRAATENYSIAPDATISVTWMGYAYAFWTDAGGGARQESMLLSDRVMAIPVGGVVDGQPVLDDVQITLNPQT